ncbi:glycoside hydrolase family 88 protein [Paenibacillus wynnii]|uniref:glycoside hydrolase family 88 protein n=1 Tax=Paenibacillus wynnii TaxID=268407 RepID=UPI00068C8F46|nr:glycoside hydrolase family 88 protein [Paenibacillus wynnii]
MIIQSIAGILLLIAVIVLLIDVVPIAGDWLGRIHIGRFTNRQVWGQSITDKGIVWLNKTPKIKVTDHTRLIVLDMLQGNYSKSAIQHWQEAAILLGLNESMRHREDKRSAKSIRQYLSSKFSESGDWKVNPDHVDVGILAYAVMNQTVVDSGHYKPAMDKLWQLIQEHIGEDGTVQYRKWMKDYRYVDTIGFICPFLISYGLKYNKPECVQLAVKQIKAYEHFGMLNEQYIPCHAYHIKTRFPLGLYGWGRGLGWYAIGLIDAWRELPDHHECKETLKDSVIKFARSVLPLQNPEGNWNWTATRSESRSDSSATATLGWFMLHASSIEELSEDCDKSADQAVNYLMKVTRRNGAVDFSQGDTKDIGVYSSLFNVLPFTQGFCIRTIHKRAVEVDDQIIQLVKSEDKKDAPRGVMA